MKPWCCTLHSLGQAHHRNCPSHLPERPWPAGVEPDFDQLVDWIFCMNRDQLEFWLARIRPMMDAGNRCLQYDHDRQAERVSATLAIDSADHATRSRDYGRGFADALRLVRRTLA